MFTLSCHGRSTAAWPVALSLTVYTTIGCRSSRDIPIGRTTLLHLRKRRYLCDCGKRFFEKNTLLPRYYRSTSRLVAEIITAFRKTVSASKIGTQFNVSGATAMRYFKCVSFKPTRPPEVLSIKDSENISKNPGIF